MPKFFCFALAVMIMLSSLVGLAQNASPDKSRPWTASWVCSAGDNGKQYGVYYFRKNFTLANKPSHFFVHVSADNRYKLYVNGNLVSLGPARGDTNFWNFETVDLAAYLTPGKNLISALVFNEAEFRPEAQISQRTAFILQGNSPAEEIVNTNNSWKCIRDPGHHPIPGYFFAATRGELVDMNQAITKDWHAVNYDDNNWPAAAVVMQGTLKGMAWGIDWALVPSSLPQMELSNQRLLQVRKASGITPPAGFPQKSTPVTIPANTEAVLLLDQTFETNAYVTLNFSGGKDAGISLGYAESLYQPGKNDSIKGNRDVVEGKKFIGRIDSLISNGDKGQTFTTLNFRTYRYLRIVVHTKDDPVIIDDIYGTFTGYPFKQSANFSASNPEIDKILNIGWRTARLNAWETYTDCPYYEQLQYIGDTRIQAMVTYYNTNDDRLPRNAITQIDHSRLAEGITRSCYPTKGSQIISPFSLWYVGMLHDYFKYRNDMAFVKTKLTGVRGILEFFSNYQQPDGSLKNTPYWAFVDWAGNLWGQVNGSDGSAAIFDLQLLWAYKWAAEMEARVGLKNLADDYTKKAIQLKATIRRKYWDAGKKLFADTKEKNGFSQHVNALAILTGVVDPADIRAVAEGMMSDGKLTQCSVYFKYYLNQAVMRALPKTDYMSLLGIWRENMAMGLTTWAEYSDINTSRSDCHAWGCSPNVEFYRTVLGIDSDAPGFNKIKVEPHLGSLTEVSGDTPHPNGKVSAKYKLQGRKWYIDISLPVNTPGTFVWKAKKYPLRPGANHFTL